MTDELAGRVALVTGGTRGFGRATASALARAGADVAVGYRAADNEAETLRREVVDMGRRAETFKADLSRPGAATALADAVIDAFGRVDILVNNAGIMNVTPFVEQDPTCWDDMLTVNVRSVLHLTRAVLPSMPEGGTGRIINLSSQLAHSGANSFAVYAGTKAFLLAFTKSLATEVGPYGITANCVCPGSIVTDMNRAIYPARAQAAKAAALPLRRMGTTDDVAAAVLFLAAESGGFITGQCVDVNGGNVMH